MNKKMFVDHFLGLNDCYCNRQVSSLSMIDACPWVRGRHATANAKNGGRCTEECTPSGSWTTADAEEKSLIDLANVFHV